MTAKTGVTVPALAKILGLYPVNASDPAGAIWQKNAGERMPLRRGSFITANHAGLFAIYLFHKRDAYTKDFGFRSAFVL